MQYFDNKKLLSVYLLGGIAGALLYMIFFNVFPAFQDFASQAIMLGASASVMAIVMVTAVNAPNYTINLMFIGPVKLKYIAAFYIVLDILSIASDNSGGHIAHLGGALFGYLYISQMKKGKNIAHGFDRFMDRLFSVFKPRPKVRVSYKRPMNDLDKDIQYNKSKAEKQKEIDTILDKIAKSGYDSLTKKEKETLFKNSN